MSFIGRNGNTVVCEEGEAKPYCLAAQILIGEHTTNTLFINLL